MDIQAKHLFGSSFILCMIFLLLGYLMEFKYVVNLDSQWSEYGYQFWDADPFFIFMTFLGSSYFLFPSTFLISIYLLIKKFHVAITMVWVNIIGIRLFNTLIKNIYQRERPTLEHIVDVSSYSFPSGHAMNAMAFFGMLAFIVHLNVSHRKIKIISILVATMITLLIGMSRVYLGVHFPLDVLAGYIAGAAWLTLLIGVWIKLGSKRKTLF